MKKLEVQNLKASIKKNKEALSDLESDRTLFEIKAPADGVFYLGSFEEGKWVTGDRSDGDLVKNLIPNAKAPLGRTFATFIPKSADSTVSSFLKQDAALALPLGTKGVATLSGLDGLGIPVTLDAISSTPGPEKEHAAVFVAEWPEEMEPVAGQSLGVNLVSYESQNAIAIPTKALNYGPKGWTAEVKLADGKTEQRPVTRGRSSSDQTEITAGLEAGQVIIIP